MYLEDLTSHVQISIDGRDLSDIDLLRYEVARSRIALLMLKERLGPDTLKAILREDTAKSSALFGKWVAHSDGKLTPSTADVTVKGGSAKGFLAWLNRVSGVSDEASLLGANPEHYLVQGIPHGQDVIETLGAWGWPVHFTIDFDRDIEDLVGPEAFDDAYPIRMVGAGSVAPGVDIGVVVHQFAEVEGGFKAKLAIHYPAAADPAMIEGHRTHLALEFTNWINMYLADAGIRPAG